MCHKERERGERDAENEENCGWDEYANASECHQIHTHAHTRAQRHTREAKKMEAEREEKAAEISSQKHRQADAAHAKTIQIQTLREQHSRRQVTGWDSGMSRAKNGMRDGQRENRGANDMH